MFSLVDPDDAYKICKIGFSVVSAIFICTHLIGDCQVFVFILHIWTLASNMLWLKYECTPHILLLGAENLVTLASFVCITSNTEDEMGLSRYETVAITTGMLWGIHTSHVTYLATKNTRADPYESFIVDDEF